MIHTWGKHFSCNFVATSFDKNKSDDDAQVHIQLKYTDNIQSHGQKGTG